MSPRRTAVDLGFHYAIDPASITAESVRQITDSIVADIAAAFADSRAVDIDLGFSKTTHVKVEGHIKTAQVLEA